MSYDADSIYLENLWAIGGGGHGRAQISSSGGGAWYYAPHEYIDASRIPPEATPLYYPGAGGRAHNQWEEAVTKTAFDGLVVRPVPPIQVE